MLNKKRRYVLFGTAALAGCLLFFGKKDVSAAPAMLQSTSALVYEETAEGSAPIANLVQGNTFELNGSIAAGDGSQWFSITLSDGRTGYIKGDAAVGIPDTVLAGVGDAAGEDARDADEADEALDAQEETTEESGSGEEELTTEETGESTPQVAGRQAKTYAISADARRIRLGEGQAGEDPEKWEEALGENRTFTLDGTVFVLFGTALLSLAAMAFCYRRLRRISGRPVKVREPLWPVWIENHRAGKRKRARHTKKRPAKKKSKLDKKDEFLKL